MAIFQQFFHRLELNWNWILPADVLRCISRLCVQNINTMANLLNQEYTRYGENLDYIWSNTVRFIRKYTEMFQLGFHDIKWKNKRATPGTAYIPTEVEHIANVATHGIWIIPAIFAGIHLISRAKTSTQILVAWVYGVALIFLFLISTIFHGVFYWKGHRKLKDYLHRIDRAMIYIFIAGSYFPWLNLGHPAHPTIITSLQWLVWLIAAMGITYQQMFHERYKCLETFFYIIMGIVPSVIIIMFGHDFEGMTELKLGGILYIVGIGFFKADGLIPCAHAIWHLFVVFAASVHYFAVLKHLFPNKLGY
ncbi:monocyte to macrophage differentiation factor 2 isoform X1 [Hermetia illucens]|uniref:monocyte to macrophage differentiation factor 2 isoform X1 n=2 Tax=Hermetia illucens TaxID=343691 RepID=UPI0018CC53B9|nr:monocyte to macrophage differentiation factor 2 isoform X1 [Hermetia illucens]